VSRLDLTLEPERFVRRVEVINGIGQYVARLLAAGQSPLRAGLYWNASCLKEIRSPKFWPKESLEPIIAQYNRDHPAPPPRPTPICTGQ
jgi:hypothetical protein